MDSTLGSHGSGADGQDVDTDGVDTRRTVENAEENAAEDAELPPSTAERSPSDSLMKEGGREDVEEKAEDAFSKLLASDAGTKQIGGAMI